MKNDVIPSERIRDIQKRKPADGALHAGKKIRKKDLRKFVENNPGYSGNVLAERFIKALEKRANEK